MLDGESLCIYVSLLLPQINPAIMSAINHIVLWFNHTNFKASINVFSIVFAYD